MQSPKNSPSFNVVLSFVAVALVAFVGGQVLPSVVPPAWHVASSKSLNFNDLNDTYSLLQRKFDGNIDDSKVLDGARAGVVASAGDPYTVYLDAKSAKDLSDQLSGTLSGVGAEVATKNNKLTVVAPVAESPAAKAGVQPGDWITKIDETDSSSYTLDEAVAKIRGEKGTKVKLTIVRGGDQPIEIEITRDVITVPSVKWSMKDNSVGYLQITQFGTDTADKVKQAAGELKAQGAQKIIIDLRNDPGGYLNAAVSVASQFMPEGKTVVEERHDGKTREKLSTQSGAQLQGLPTIVLINQGSASASEILAGALKDNGAAKLVGEKSFGKGSVQEVINLSGGAELKVTVAHWFTPSGKGIDKQGIQPDIEVKQTTDDFNNNRDPQLDRALQELK
jgi:carboxyl-terminal processing protease